MTEDKVTSSGGPSETEKARLSAQDKSTGSELSLMEQYLLKGERHEQIAIGEEWDKSATKKELEDWDKTWQAASKGKD